MMSDAPTTDDRRPKRSAASRESSAISAEASASAAGLLVRLLALAVVVFGVLAGLVFVVPDGNDYPLATLGKHAWLANADRERIVLVGGSNLAYGVVSKQLEQATGRHVSNMGMNGYLGVRFMLEEIKPALRERDLVVIALEYDSFVKTVEGHGKDLLMIAKTRPVAFGHLNLSQWLDVLSVIPYAAQKKALRLVGDYYKSLKPTAHAHEQAAEVPRSSTEIVASVETLAGFNRHGDLESHLGVDFPYEREEGLDLTSLGIDPEIIGLLHAFAREMDARRVPVVISYSPVMRSFYEKHAEIIAEIHRRITEGGVLAAPLPPEAFVFDEELFFDTVYHLNRVGRVRRTRKLVGSLGPFLDRAAALP